MNILQLILFVLVSLTVHAHWYIKKPDPTKHVGYPNPGKRSIPEEEINSIAIDCSRSYSQLRSYKQRAAWILRCIHTKLLLETDQNSLSSDSNDIEMELLRTSKPILYENRTPNSRSPADNSFNKFLLRSRQGAIKKK